MPTSLCVNALQMAFWRRKPKPGLSYLCVSIIVLAAFYAFALYWLGTFFNGVYSDFMRIEEKTSHFTRFFSAKSIFLGFYCRFASPLMSN
jgi:apolipoprotein N-acyltransferase